ncbi:MAG: hypothetical protein LBG52_00580 [Candidatus Peribacteria bacterium]|nr:hypothetical protein [Candidatus Peribacteria bacterium]
MVYEPTTSTNETVNVTLTLNMTGTVVSSGWTAVGDGFTFTKEYHQNLT